MEPSSPHRPDPPASDEEAFDRFAREAAASLRAPAPHDGARLVERAARRRRTVQVSAGVAAACAVLLAGIIVLAGRSDRSDRTPVIDSLPATTVPTATNAPVATVASSTPSRSSPPTSSPPPTASSASPLPVVQPLATLQPITRPAGRSPAFLAAAGDIVGVGRSPADQVLDLYDAADGSLRQTVAATVTGVPLVAGFGSIWVVDEGTPVVYRVDPQSGAIQATIPIVATRSGGGAAVNNRGVWLVSGHPSHLERIDPSTNTVEQIPVPDNAFGVGATDDAIWVSTSGGTLYRLDSVDHHQVASIALGGEPQYVLARGSDVWVLGRTRNFNSVVHHIDASTNRVRASIIVDDNFDPRFFFYDVEVAGGFVWVTPPSTTLLVKIDPATDTVVARYNDTNNGGGDVVAVGNTLWVANPAAGTISRIPLD